jgi:two-component system cell cycle sensor histidine kinase/response regulator CckA
MADRDPADARRGDAEELPLWVRGLAHDLNQLLSTVLGRVQLLGAQAGTAESRRQLAEIEAAARDAAVLVRRILEGERALSGEGRREVALDGLVESGLSRARLHARRTRGRDEPAIAVHVRIPPALTVRVPPTAARQVLSNVLVNALEAMPDGGRLDVTARVDGATATVLVRDSGPGMDASTLAAAVEARGRSDKEHGHGIGLGAARLLLEELGGSLALESAPGEGTLVAVGLPAGTPAARASSEPPAAPAADGQAPAGSAADAPLRCLLVDDEPRVREMVAEILSVAGHAAEARAGAAEALADFAAGAWDVVLADLEMPGGDGLELARRVRDLDPDVVIALVSGWGGERAGVEADRDVVDLVVHKPLDVTKLYELAAAVRRLRERRRRR